MRQIKPFILPSNKKQICYMTAKRFNEIKETEEINQREELLNLIDKYKKDFDERCKDSYSGY